MQHSPAGGIIMPLRYRVALLLLAVCIPIAMSPAFAARPAPVRVALPHPTQINGTNGSCFLGQTVADAAYIWFFPSDDYYYTFFDPTACGCALVKNYVAHWVLFWPTPCQIHAQVWILPAVNVGGGCYVPNTAASPPDPTTGLCNSAIVLLDGSAGGLIDHTVPLPAGCDCLNGPFFVLFKIVDSQCPIDPSSGALSSPAIVVDNTPDPCISYNAYPGSGGPVDMVPNFGFPGNTTMFVEADCCVVPNLPGTWGKLKTLYR